MGLERGPLSLVSTIEELLEKKVTAPVQKPENTAVGIRHADHVAACIRKFGTNFTDNRRSLGRYSSLADSSPRSLFVCWCYKIPTLREAESEFCDYFHAKYSKKKK
jgi:hypothetical protein